MSVKYVIGISIRIELNLQMALRRQDTLMVLILPIQQHVACCHLFVPALISFFHVVYFSE